MPNITSAIVKELRTLTNAAMMDCKKALVEADGNIEIARDLLRKKGQIIAGKKASRKTNEGKVLIRPDASGNKVAMIKVNCETDFVARNEQFGAFLEKLADLALKHGPENFSRAEDEDGQSVEKLITASIAEIGENLVLDDPAVYSKSPGKILGNYTHMNGKIGVIVELEGADETPEAAELAKDISMHVAASNVQALSENDLPPEVIEKEKQFLVEQAMESGKPKEIAEKMVLGRLQKFKKEISLLDQPFVKDPSTTIAGLLDSFNQTNGTSLKVATFSKASV